ncbi:hypothetical protein LTR17_005964 [Elasticomyces elasticus]|nr:hypothetical protein LTR17_005964 [Elasticomyces elasticus]
MAVRMRTFISNKLLRIDGSLEDYKSSNTAPRHLDREHRRTIQWRSSPHHPQHTASGPTEPLQTKRNARNTIYSFPDALTVSGIAEIAPDVFAMAVGNFTLTGGPQQGSFSIWSVGFTIHDTLEAHKITSLPQASFLNGLCNLPGTGSPQDILVGDLKQGLVYHVDTSTGEYGIAINNSLMAAFPVPVLGTVGINGMHVHDGDLFFTNTGQALFAKMPIHTNGTAADKPTIIARVLNSSLEFDDFAIKDNDAYLVTGSGNSIEWIGLDGTSKGRIVAGSLNSTQFAEPTSCAFGRTEADRHILYVVTAGGLATPVDGNVTIGAQVLAVDTRLWLV